MQRLSSMVKGVSGILDKLAGICIFAVMLLIVANIIFRTGLKQPILGTYELVGFLTAMAVAFALAQCAFQNGHIAVSFVMERFSQRIQSIVSVFVHAVSLVFWSAVVCHLARFAHAMQIRGLVSPSAEIPVYPFIYFVALGLLGLCLVLMLKYLVSITEVFQRR